MAHELTINKLTGKTEMFYVGEAPWHGLGQRLPQVATADQAIAAAGLAWTVNLQPMYVHREGQAYEITDHRAVVRSDTHDVVGVVGTDFRPVQNRELFDFCDALVGEAAAMYHTAGSLRGGSRVWVLCKMPNDLMVVPGDAVEKFFLLATGHDGGMSLTGRFTGTRVVCANTLSAALKEPGLKWEVEVRHTQHVKSRVEEARRVLQLSLKYFDVLGRKLQALSVAQISELELQQYLQAVFPLTKNAKGEESTRTQHTHEVLAYLFEHGRGNQLPGVKGSAWAALNAVTEYVDHVRGVKKDGTVRATWAEAALFGSGHWIKQRAFDEALSLIGAN